MKVNLIEQKREKRENREDSIIPTNNKQKNEK